jgi:hypothetical protein
LWVYDYRDVFEGAWTASMYILVPMLTILDKVSVI